MRVESVLAKCVVAVQNINSDYGKDCDNCLANQWIDADAINQQGHAGEAEQQGKGRSDIEPQECGQHRAPVVEDDPPLRQECVDHCNEMSDCDKDQVMQ